MLLVSVFTLISILNGLFYQAYAYAEECPRFYKPDFVQMRSGILFHVNKNGGFTPLSSLNNLNKWGKSVIDIKNNTCQCTIRAYDNNYHPNFTCQKAYNQGLK